MKPRRNLWGLPQEQTPSLPKKNTRTVMDLAGPSSYPVFVKKHKFLDKRGKRKEPLTASFQFNHSAVSNSLRPHESQHARPPCPSRKSNH